MSCADCVNNGIPELLCSHGKDAPVSFIDGELVFRRHNQPGSQAELQALTASEIGNKIFQLDNDSYNRSTLSEPHHVLLVSPDSDQTNLDYYQDYGIISLDVDEVNNIHEVVHINNKEHKGNLRVVHAVEPCNYSHSEIHLYLDGNLYAGKAPKSARPFFRRQLQAALNVVRQYHQQ
jgi:hypothetical protein